MKKYVFDETLVEELDHVDIILEKHFQNIVGSYVKKNPDISLIKATKLYQKKYPVYKKAEDFTRKMYYEMDKQKSIALGSGSKKESFGIQKNVQKNLSSDYSITEKIKYYSKRVNDTKLTNGQRHHAKVRLSVLQK